MTKIDAIALGFIALAFFFCAIQQYKKRAAFTKLKRSVIDADKYIQCPKCKSKGTMNWAINKGCYILVCIKCDNLSNNKET